jgi:hypothetical protein
VKWAIATNPHTPSHHLARLAGDSKDTYTRRMIAGNPNTPPEILAHLVLTGDQSIREKVVHNENASVALLALLIQDQDEEIRQVALDRFRVLVPSIQEKERLYAQGTRWNVGDHLWLLGRQTVFLDALEKLVLPFIGESRCRTPVSVRAAQSLLKTVSPKCAFMQISVRSIIKIENMQNRTTPIHQSG